MERREPGQCLQTEPGFRRREQGRQGPASSSKGKGQRGHSGVGKEERAGQRLHGGDGLSDMFPGRWKRLNLERGRKLWVQLSDLAS